MVSAVAQAGQPSEKSAERGSSSSGKAPLTAIFLDQGTQKTKVCSIHTYLPQMCSLLLTDVVIQSPPLCPRQCVYLVQK